MTPEEAQALITKEPRNKDVLFPYLNGEDLNGRPDQSPSRWVINYFDWPLDRSAAGRWAKGTEKERKEWLREGRVPADYPDPVAADYPDCLAILEAKVKPERTRKRTDGKFQLRYPLYLRWWQYGDKRPELYATIAGLKRVLCRARVANINSISFIQRDIVPSEATVVFANDTHAFFAVVQCSIHICWLEQMASSMRTDIRYTPSDCFETFAFPETTNQTEQIGKTYYDIRQVMMRKTSNGLTATYNRFHNPDETAPDIARFREIHVETDKAVTAAYGWDDLDLGHCFHETKQGVRFTLSERARAEVLDRLLALNHQRYAEEVAQGLHDKTQKKLAKAKPKPAVGKPVQPDVDLGFELT